MKIVWVNGCFDVLHRGHIEMLKYAKTLGNKLIVGIDYDHRVKIAKSPSRPFNTFEDRKFVLEALRCVDTVIGYGTDTELENYIKSFSPDCMVIGSDWRGKDIIGQEFAKEIRFFERIEKYSTTKILEGK